MAMAVIKDLPKVDAENIGAEEEIKVLEALLESFSVETKNELIGIWKEYQEGKTPASRFVRLAEILAYEIEVAIYIEKRVYARNAIRRFLGSISDIIVENAQSNKGSSPLSIKKN